jgi:signal transduction histidine kinase
MSNLTHRAALQALLSEGYVQLERDQEAREAATAGLSRIAGDLHDGIGQELTGVALLLRSVADEAGTARRLKEVLNQVIGHVNSAIESTRTLAHGLAPLKLDDGCLGTALGGLAKQAQKLHRLQVETQCDALCAPLAPYDGSAPVPDRARGNRQCCQACS